MNPGFLYARQALYLPTHTSASSTLSPTSHRLPYYPSSSSLLCPKGSTGWSKLSRLIHQQWRRRRGGAGGGVSRRPSPRGPWCPSPLSLIAVAARPTPPARVRGQVRAPHGPDGGDPGFRGRRAPLSSSLAVREIGGEGEAGCCPSRPLSLRDSASSRQEVKVPGGVRMAQLN